MKPASALRLLRWIVLALLLTGLGRAGAQEAHRLDLDQTRATLTATETALRDKSLDDAGLQNSAQPDRRACPRVAGNDCRPRPSPRGLDEASRRAHAQIWPARASDRPRRQGSREREEKARQDRRKLARRARHVAGGQRRQHAHQRGAASVVRGANVRSLVERFQSAALGRCRTGAPGRRRGGPQSHRQLARRDRRTAAARQDRHGRDCGRARAGRGSAWLDRAPVRLSGRGRDDAEPIAPRARRRLDIRDLRRAAARRSGHARRRAQLLRSLRSEHAGGHRRRASRRRAC